MKSNQIKIGALLSYAQLFLSVIISISINKIILSKIGQSEYGIINLATSTLSYLNLLSLGLGSAFIRFNMRYRVNQDIENERKLNGVFLIIFILISVIMAVVGVGLLFCAEDIFPLLSETEIYKLRIIMIISLVQTCLELPFSIFTININAYEKYIFGKCVGIINTVLAPIGKLVIVLIGYKAIGMTLVVFALAMLSHFCEMFYAIKYVGVRFKLGKMENKLIKSLFVFSFFIVLNQIIDMINWQVDKLILGIVAGTTSVAIYSFGASLNTYVMSFSTAISGVLGPRVNKLIAGNADKSEIENLFIETGRIQFIVLALIMLGFIFFGKPFIECYYGTQEYSESYYVALLLILPLLIPLIQNLGIEIQRAYNKHHFRSIIYGIIAIINIAISIPLAINYGPIGSAIGTCISLVVGNGFLMNWYYHYKLGINMKKFWWNIIKFIPALIFPIIVGVVLMLFVDLTNIWFFLLSIFAFSVIYFFSMWFLGMNNNEKNIIRKPLNRIFKRENNV